MEFAEEVRALWQQKQVCAAAEETLKAEKSKLQTMKAEALKKMEAAEIDKFNVPEHGTIYRQKKFSIKVPKDPTAKQALFDYIEAEKGEDVLHNMTSINSQTLNSFYKEELELAKERQDVDWKLPGIGEPSVYYDMGMRKS